MNESSQDKLETRCKQPKMQAVLCQVASVATWDQLHIRKQVPHHQVESIPDSAVKILIDLAITKKASLPSHMIHTLKHNLLLHRKHTYLGINKINQFLQIKHRQRSKIHRVILIIHLLVPTIRMKKQRKNDEQLKRPKLQLHPPNLLLHLQ